MNDFTKEELYDLKYAIEKFSQPGKDFLGFYKLRNKIQTMIDNYCDHEKIKETACCGMVITYTSVPWSIPKCHKCGRDLNDNPI